MLPGRGRSEPSPATSSAGACRANRARRSSGPVTISARAWPLVWIRSERALRLATISARIASTCPSRPFGAPAARPDWAARAALTASSGPGLARPPPVLPVGTIHLHHPHPRRGDVPGQAGTVPAGPFDAGQAHRAEPAQPAQQLGISSRGGRELGDAEQPADRVERGGDVHVGVGVHATGDSACLHACLYDGHCHPFLNVDGLRDGTHPLAARTCEPRPLTQARQIRPAAPVGALKRGPADRSFRRTARAGVSRIAGQAGPVPDPTPQPGQTLGSRAGSTTHTLPAEYALTVEGVLVVASWDRTSRCACPGDERRPCCGSLR